MELQAKMHTGRRGENGDGPGRVTKLRRRNAVGRLERPRECLMRFVTRAQRHLYHLIPAGPQLSAARSNRSRRTWSAIVSPVIAAKMR